MSFADEIRERNADFLLRHLDHASELLAAGCGDDTISVGRAGQCTSVTAIDANKRLDAAAAHATRHEITYLALTSVDCDGIIIGGGETETRQQFYAARKPEQEGRS